MWRSSSPELEGFGAFGYGPDKVASDVPARNSAGYVGGYTVANRANGGNAVIVLISPVLFFISEVLAFLVL